MYRIYAADPPKSRLGRTSKVVSDSYAYGFLRNSIWVQKGLSNDGCIIFRYGQSPQFFKSSYINAHQEQWDFKKMAYKFAITVSRKALAVLRPKYDEMW